MSLIIAKTLLNLLLNLLELSSLAGSIFLLVSEREKVAPDQSSVEPWSVGQKVLIFFLTVFSPVISGAILYYGLRKRCPTKARAANWFSFLGLVIYLAIAYSLGRFLH